MCLRAPGDNNSHAKVRSIYGAPSLQAVAGWKRGGKNNTAVETKEDVQSPPIWSAPVPQEALARMAVVGSSPRQIYVNGKRAQRTSGNATVLFGAMKYRGGTPGGKQTPKGVVPSGTAGYTVQHPTLKGWSAPADMEFVYRAQIEPWTEPRPVKSPWTLDLGNQHTHWTLTTNPQSVTLERELVERFVPPFTSR